MSATAHPGMVPAAARGTPPPGRQKTRTLNVPVPESVYWHVRTMAVQSRVPFKCYLARFLAEARPYPPPDEASADDQHPAPAQDLSNETTGDTVEA